MRALSLLLLLPGCLIGAEPPLQPGLNYTDLQMIYHVGGWGVCGAWGAAASCSGEDRAPAGRIDQLAGKLTVCGVRPNGNITCNGKADDPQVFDAPDGSFVDIDVGYWHMCALSDTGSVSCWGENDYGESTDSPGPYIDMCAGDNISCGLDEAGAVSCWGQFDSDSRVPEGTGYTSISCVGGAVAALHEDGHVDVTDVAGSPSRTTGWLDGDWAEVTGGPDNFCAVDSLGVTACFGEGPIVNDTPSTTGLRSMSIGDDTACAVDPDNHIVCWGDKEGLPDGLR